MKMHSFLAELAKRNRSPYCSPPKTCIGVPRISLVGFLTGQGGDAVLMMELARGLQDLGYPVELILPDIPTAQPFAERCRVSGLPVELSSLLDSDANGETDHSLRRLMVLFHRIRDSVIHIHTGDLVLPRKAMAALHLVRLRRVIVTIHHPYAYLDPRSARARLWCMTVKRRIATVVCPSAYGYRIQRNLGVPHQKLAIIRNGVDVSWYRSGNAMRVRQGPLRHLPQDAQILLHTARMEPGKRPQDALDGFLKIALKYPRAHLVFAGLGSLRAELEAHVPQPFQHRVHFVGFQTNLPDWLAAATVWIHASEGENYSTALLQALAARLPVAATMCSGNDEVLVPGRNALTFPIGDADGLASALRCLLDQPELRARLSAEAGRTAEQNSLQQMIETHRKRCYEISSG